MVTLHKGTPMTLKSVFQSMNLSTYDLTVDMLDVHAVSAHKDTRHEWQVHSNYALADVTPLHPIAQVEQMYISLEDSIVIRKVLELDLNLDELVFRLTDPSSWLTLSLNTSIL